METDAGTPSAEIFNPTCTSYSLADFSILFLPLPVAPQYQDLDWANATVIPLNTLSQAVLLVRG